MDRVLPSEASVGHFRADKPLLTRPRFQFGWWSQVQRRGMISPLPWLVFDAPHGYFPGANARVDILHTAEVDHQHLAVLPQGLGDELKSGSRGLFR